MNFLLKSKPCFVADAGTYKCHLLTYSTSELIWVSIKVTP